VFEDKAFNCDNIIISIIVVVITLTNPTTAKTATAARNFGSPHFRASSMEHSLLLGAERQKHELGSSLIDV
jgi:hypothetical protein